MLPLGQFSSVCLAPSPRRPPLGRGQRRDDVLVQRDAFALGRLDELLMERDGHADVCLAGRSRGVAAARFFCLSEPRAAS